MSVLNLIIEGKWAHAWAGLVMMLLLSTFRENKLYRQEWELEMSGGNGTVKGKLAD